MDEIIMNVNIKRDFESIIRNYGHNVYLQRVENAQEGNEKPSYASKLERWTVCSMFPGGSVRADSTLGEDNEGWTSDIDMVFYFQANANPTIGDLIYEEVNRFPNHESVYSIDFAIPMRGRGGTIIFWEVAAMRVVPT